MKKQTNIATTLALCSAFVLAVTACGTMTRKLEKQDPETNRLGLSFAHEDKTSNYIDSVYTVTMPADLDSIPDSDGNYHKIARTTTDESGVSMPTWELQGVVVEQRLKNVAERNGVVNLDFIVTVPKTLINDRWQLESIREHLRTIPIGLTCNRLFSVEQTSSVCRRKGTMSTRPLWPLLFLTASIGRR